MDALDLIRAARHAEIDRHAQVALLEISRAAMVARLKIADLAGWHARSIGQQRRFNAAKLKQGDLK